MTPAREWGPWTELKLDVLDGYLRGFTAATTRARERVYLDAFAGEGFGVSRLTRQQFHGSARIALDIDKPPFTRIRLFELRKRKAEQLQRQVDLDYPGRDIRVYPGDCNVAIPHALRDLAELRWAPTFAFLDPDGMELAWSSLEVLAEHRRREKTKVELWMLFPTSGLYRNLALLPEELTVAQGEKADRLYGTGRWRAILQRRQMLIFDYADALLAYVNLMRWQLESQLHYKTTMALEVKNTRGIVLYHMIFATDHDVGEKIMISQYKKAGRQAPVIRQDLRDAGQLRLEMENLVEPDLLIVGPAPSPPDLLH